MGNLLNELKRRNVFKVGIAYLALGWVMIQVTSMAVPALNLPETLNSIVFYLGLIGFPFALFFAWAFELTPDGVKPTRDIEEEHSIRHVTGRKLDFAIMGILVIALVGVVYDSYLSPTTQAASNENEALKSTPPSIAVLAFEDFSPNKDQEYFADGISDEILNLLAKTNAMQVTGRTSSFSFKGKDDDIRAIASKLDVEHVLEGSISKSGNKIKITAQLINAEGNHIWSETYKRELTDIFEIQEEIAMAILRELKAKLLGEEITIKANSTTNMEAFDLYLRGLQGLRAGSFASLADGRVALEQALLLDPDFVLARVKLVEVIAGQIDTGSVTLPSAIDEVMQMANDLVDANPEMLEAQMALAAALDAYVRSPDQAGLLLAHMEKLKARGVNSAEFYSYYGRTQLYLDQPSQAIDYLAKAILLDPMNGFSYLLLGGAYNLSGQQDRAIDVYKKGTEVAPSFPHNWSWLGQTLTSKGEFMRAVPYQERAFTLDDGDPEQADNVTDIYLTLQDFEKAQLWSDKALSLGPLRARSKRRKAQLLFADGNRDKALEVVSSTLNNKDTVYRSYRKTLIDIGFSIYLAEGDYEAAEQFLLDQVPDIQDFIDGPTIDSNVAFWNNYESAYHIPDLISLYRLTGRHKQADKLIRHFNWFTPWILRSKKLSGENHHTLGWVSAIDKKDDMALDYLEKAVDQGYLMDWQFEYQYNPAFYGLHDNPRFIKLIERIKTKISQQRELLEAEMTKKRAKIDATEATS